MNEQDKNTDLLEQRALQLWDQAALRQEMAEWKKEKATLETSAAQTAPGPKLFLGLSRARIMQLAAAASVALVLGFFFFAPRTNHSALASEYFEETLSNVKGGQDAPEQLEQATAAMSEKRYADALALLPAAAAGGYGETAQLLRGECHFRLGQYPAALEAYQALQQPSVSTPNRERAEWLTVLTLLASKQTGPDFQQRLNAIAGNPEHGYYPQAVGLRGRL